MLSVVTSRQDHQLTSRTELKLATTRRFLLFLIWNLEWGCSNWSKSFNFTSFCHFSISPQKNWIRSIKKSSSSVFCSFLSFSFDRRISFLGIQFLWKKEKNWVLKINSSFFVRVTVWRISGLANSRSGNYGGKRLPNRSLTHKSPFIFDVEAIKNKNRAVRRRRIVELNGSRLPSNCCSTCSQEPG